MTVKINDLSANVYITFGNIYNLVVAVNDKTGFGSDILERYR